jgi:RimJ/RimL family protein N-acetyltransferase
VLEKLGFRAIGVHQHEAWVDGAWRDHLAYELLAEAWRAALPPGPADR